LKPEIRRAEACRGAETSNKHDTRTGELIAGTGIRVSSMVN
jgi:hypothetical protein